MELLNAIETRINKCQRQKDFYSRTLKNLENPSLVPDNGMKELKELIACSKIKRIKKKQVVFYEGDSPQGLYLVMDGRIKTIKRALDGRQFITSLYNTDDYIGIDSLLLEEPFTETAEATQDTSICLLPKEQVVTLLNKYPGISHYFIKILSQNIHQKAEQLLELAYLSARKRIAKILIRLSSKSPSPILQSLSRDGLAELAGVALETVSRTFSDFME